MQSAGPFLERQVELPSGRTFYVEAGKGIPLVLVHGLLGSCFSWRKNIPALAEHFRVLALDLVGCGRSEALREDKYGIEACSRQLEKFLDALELPAVHLLGTSTGGAVALDFAARRGDRLKRLVLVAPLSPFSRWAAFLSRMSRLPVLPDIILGLLVRNATQLAPFLFRHLLYSHISRLTPETIPGYLEGIRVEVTVPMLRQALRGWQPSHLASRLGHVMTPTLLVWGEEDKPVPLSSALPLLARLPSATLVMIPRAGHLCYEEFPELFDEKVLSFFRSAPLVP